MSPINHGKCPHGDLNAWCSVTGLGHGSSWGAGFNYDDTSRYPPGFLHAPRPSAPYDYGRQREANIQRAVLRPDPAPSQAQKSDPSEEAVKTENGGDSAASTPRSNAVSIFTSSHGSSRRSSASSWTEFRNQVPRPIPRVESITFSLWEHQVVRPLQDHGVRLFWGPYGSSGDGSGLRGDAVAFVPGSVEHRVQAA